MEILIYYFVNLSTCCYTFTDDLTDIFTSLKQRILSRSLEIEQNPVQFCCSVSHPVMGTRLVSEMKRQFLIVKSASAFRVRGTSSFPSAF